ncbi:hypothetical protein HWV62_27067 [Athelia sp. TMB]|nr:hypothetical protein HWV62_27067 [Athelia sp. TMB]
MQSHLTPSSFGSISELAASLPPGEKVDAILVCHDFSDHCHEATLRGAKNQATIFAQGKARKNIRGWGWFDCVGEIPITRNGVGKSLRELAVNAGMKDPEEMPENISVAYVPTNNQWDMAGTRLHGATIISFSLSFCSSDSQSFGVAFEYELESHSYAIVYAPHGIPASSLAPWRTAHPDVQVLALIHGFDEIDNPWWLAGTINLGRRSALPLCALLSPKVWVATHDEDKEAQGLVARVIKRKRWTVRELRETLAHEEKGAGRGVEVRVLESGEMMLLGA